MEAFRHTLFARLCLLLLAVILHADAVAEASGAWNPVAVFEAAGECAARETLSGRTASETLSGGTASETLPEGPDAGTPYTGPESLDVQDFIESPQSDACLHRLPRLLRTLPDAAPAFAAETPRRETPSELFAPARILRTPRSLLCVYRI